MGGSSKGLAAALRHRDFRLLLAGEAISGTGDWLYSIAIVVYVLDVTGSGASAWVAATSIVRFVPYVALGTFGGVIADRYNRRTVMIVSDLARAVIMSGLTIVAAVRGPALAVVVLAGASTVFSSAFSPAAQAATPTLVGEDDLAAANTLSSTVENVALALGPAIGGILLILGSPVVAFGVNAATFVVSAALTLGIRTSLTPTDSPEGEPTLRERIVQGFSAIRTTPTVRVLLAISITFSVFYGMEIVLYALASERLFRIGDDGLSFLWAAIGLGGILAVALTGRVAARPSQAGTFAIASVLSAIPMIVLAFVHVPAAIYALVMIEGAMVVIGDVIFMTLLQRTIEGEVLGRVFGILDSLLVGGILVGTVLAPVLFDAIGLRGAMLAAGGIVVVMTALALPKARAVDRDAEARARATADTVDLLERADIFESATRPVIEGLARAAETVTVPAGTRIVAEGDPAEDLFVIASGAVRVTREGRLLAELGPEDHFGEIGVLERLPRTATVEAATDCVLERIRGEDFLRAVSAGPRLSGRLLSTIATRLARTHPEHGLGGA